MSKRRKHQPPPPRRDEPAKSAPVVMPARRPGQPTKLTPEVIQQAVALVDKCPRIENIANRLGVGASTFWAWLKRGEKERKRLEKDGETASAHEAIYAEFSESIKRALAELEAAHYQAVACGGNGWQSHAWVLERRWPDGWASCQKELARMQKDLAKLVKQEKAS